MMIFTRGATYEVYNAGGRKQWAPKRILRSCYLLLRFGIRFWWVSQPALTAASQTRTKRIAYWENTSTIFFFLFFFHSASGLSFSSYPCYTLWSLPGGSANGTVPWEPTVGIYWMRGKNISLTSMADGLSTVHPLHKAIGKFLENIIILHGMKGELCSSLLPRLYDKTQHNISTHHMWNKTWACILQLLKVRCICLDIWWQIKRT